MFCFVVVVTTNVKVENVTQPQENIIHTTTTLSEARSLLAATSSGELVFFVGGINSTGYASDRVDIYNVTSGTWTTSTLSIPCSGIVATSSQNFVFFGGSRNQRLDYCNRVDIYNTLNGSWCTATLSLARLTFVVTSVRNLVLFGGGFVHPTGPSNVVDIYNVTSNTWTTATLSQARYLLATTSVDNRYALFGGGWLNGTGQSDVVDIFDSLSGTWNTSTLSQARSDLVATSLRDLAFFGGGNDGFQQFNVVDIFNSTSNTWSNTTLSEARYYHAAASIGEIVAFGGGWNRWIPLAVVDMFNVTSNTWFTVNLSQPRFYLAATSSKNKIFFGGGGNNLNLFDIVDVFCFGENCQTSPPSSSPFSTISPFSVSTQSLTEGPTPLITNDSLPISQTTPVLTPSISEQTPFQQMDELPAEVVVGVAVGTASFLLTVGLTIFVIFFTKKRKKRITTRDEETSTSDPQQEPLLHEVYEALNTQIRTSSQIVQSQESIDNVELSNKHYIPFEEIEIQKELAKGSYGRICLGLWNGAPVALKFCREREKIDDFWKEVNLLIELSPHPNVVQVFGVSKDGSQPVLVLEYCAGGSLDKLLFETKRSLSEKEKIELVKGIARGMLHLHKHNIVHRDLAARNILLSGTGDPKISDFGMSRVLQREEGKTKTDFGPIRWMAPESLADLTYSKKSDVWSFGIVVYEIVAECEPHRDVDRLDVGPLIRDHCLTPKIPDDCPPLLRQLMQLCWKKEPDQRPSFKEICNLLKS